MVAITSAEANARAQPCGSCTVCCRLIPVLELDKPSDVWCRHCARGKGCRIYEDRPQSCRDYNCLWRLNPWMGDNLKPERCKVVFEATEDGQVILGFVDPHRPNAHQRQDVARFITAMQARGRSVLIRVRRDQYDMHLSPQHTERDVWASVKATWLRQMARRARPAEEDDG